MCEIIKRMYVRICFLPVCVKWNEGARMVECANPGCQPSVLSASYITLTGHFTPWFRIPAERPPQTHWVVPARWERHSQPAEHHVWTAADWPWSQICPAGKIMTNDFFIFSFFSLENWSFSNSTATLLVWPLKTGKEEGSVSDRRS